MAASKTSPSYTTQAVFGGSTFGLWSATGGYRQSDVHGIEISWTRILAGRLEYLAETIAFAKIRVVLVLELTTFPDSCSSFA